MDFQVGTQVLVNNKYRATIRYVGLVAFAEGVWFGVELEKPVGKHNGEVLGRTYFRTAPKHGTFVRAESLTPYTAETEAAAKLGSVMKMSLVKKKTKGEVLFRAFNTLDASDESMVLARRQALMNSALGSKLTRDRPSPESITEWEKEAAAMVIPSDYTGPHLTFPITKAEDVVKMMEAFKAGEVLHYKYALGLIAGYARYAGELPTLVPVTVERDTRLTIVGDTHGQLQDLLSIFTLNGIPSPSNRYLMNGDFVDRGQHSIEIVLTLFAFCLLFPGQAKTSAGGCCLLNRGNHESHNQNLTGGLFAEVLDKYATHSTTTSALDPELGLKLYDTLQVAFDNMPLVHLIGSADSAAAMSGSGSGGLSGVTSPTASPQPSARLASSSRSSLPGSSGGGSGTATPGRRIFVTHGGLTSHPGVTLNSIASINRKREIPYGSPLHEDHVFESLEWSDPRAPNGTTPSDRGAGSFFGPDITHAFCQRNGVALIVRSHECVQEGYSLMHDNRVLTVFSASRYCGRGNNRGSFVTFFPNLRHRIVQYTACPLVSDHLKPGAEPMPFLKGNAAMSSLSAGAGGSGGGAASMGSPLSSPTPIGSPSLATNSSRGVIDSHMQALIEASAASANRIFDCVVAIPDALLSERGSVPGLTHVIPGLDHHRRGESAGPKIEDGVAPAFVLSSPAFASPSSANAAASEGVRKMLMERVVLERANLYSHWNNLPSQAVHHDGCITRLEWAEGMRKVLKLDLPWVSLAPILCVFEEGTNNTRINYSRFLDRYRIAAVGEAASHWIDSLINQICQKLFKTCGSLEAAFSHLDRDGSGEISLSELEEGLGRLNLGITKAQIVDFISVLDRDKSGSVSWPEFESRFRLLFSKLHDDEAAGQRKRPPQSSNSRNSSVSSSSSSMSTSSSGRGTPTALDAWAKDTLRKVGAALFGSALVETPGDVAAHALLVGNAVREAFRLLDLNKDGLVSQEELLIGVQKLNLGLSDDDVSRLLVAIDSNASGWINYQEWCESMVYAGVIPANSTALTMTSTPSPPSTTLVVPGSPVPASASPSSPSTPAGKDGARARGNSAASNGSGSSPSKKSSRPFSPVHLQHHLTGWSNRRGAIDAIMALLFEFRCELGAAFRLFDVDGDGEITRQEFRDGLRALQALSASSSAGSGSSASSGSGSATPFLSDEAADALLDSLDVDGNGTISFAEFVNAFQILDAEAEGEGADGGDGIASGSAASSGRMMSLA